MSQAGRFTSGSGAIPIETLTGNTGGAVPPDGSGNINILGNAVTGMSVAGDAGTNTLTISAADATESQKGVVELATNAEAIAGTASTNVAIIPSSLTAKLGVQTANGVAYGAGSSAAIGWTAAGTTGQVLTATTGLAPSWQTPAAVEIDITGDTGGAQTGDAFTFTGGATGLSFAGSSDTFTLDGTLVVGNGGTGAATFTAYAPIIAGTTATGPFQSALTGLSTSGFVLTSNGAAAVPSFQALPASGITSIAGDTGGAQSGPAITLAGGTTGLSFGGAANTITTTFAGITANGGAVSLATDATTSTINVGTGAGVKTSTFGSTNSTSATTVQSGSGALNVTATGGTLTINSGTGALSISNDASATTVNLATGAAAKTVTVGSTNTTSSLALKYGTSDFTIASATGTVMRAEDTGEITFPLQSAFLAFLGSDDNNVTGNGALYTIGTNTALTEVFDQNSDFNTNGTFTAPVTGKYSLGNCNSLFGATVGTGGQSRITTSNRTYFYFLLRAASNNQYNMPVFALADMDVGDTATFQVLGQGEAGNSQDLDGDSGAMVTYVYGNLVC